MWMNDYEIELALRRFGDDTPNLQRGVQILLRLVTWTNRNSDGWGYWQKPSRAASSLMDLLHAADRFDPVDVTEADLNKTLRPIKAFLTREKVEHSTILEPPPPPPPVRNWRQEFVNLFTAVAACEAPEGSQVDDVLADFQPAFDETTAEGSQA